MSSRSFFALSLIAGLALLPGIACARTIVLAAPGPNGLEGWERHHPAAAQDLGGWVKGHPAAARQFFDWDAQHPERSHAFVTWAIQHPGAGIQAFAVEHPGWPFFDQIMKSHAPAANAFMGWCRKHPEAAETLMNHPGGLDWAGRHLYAGAWSMEAGGR